MFLSYIVDNDNNQSRQQQLELLLQQARTEVIAQKQENLVIILEKVVEIVLYSRPICRQYNGQPLFGIYLKIYSQAESKLLKYITEEIDDYSYLASNTKELYWIQTQIFKIILDDANLKELALTAQNQPPNSSLRSYALRELVKAIELSQRLIKMRSYGVSSQFEKLIYEEAVMETLAYVCTKIDLYDPNRGKQKFMNWVNFKLEKMLLKCRQEFQNPNIIQIHSWSDLENLNSGNAGNDSSDFSQLLYHYIEQDSNNIFTSVFVNGYPEANFKEIALARLSGDTWKEIAQHYGLSIPTLSSFFKRNCQKFQYLFEKEFKT